jgi:hypothetical protein
MQRETKNFVSVFVAIALAISSLVLVQAPAQAADKVSISVSGFASNSSSLTSEIKNKINRFVKQNPGYSYVSCVGFADQAGSPSANLVLGKQRAVASCNQVTLANRSLKIDKTKGKHDTSGNSSNLRRVKITLSNTLSGKLETKFKVKAGTISFSSKIVKAGKSFALPTATRDGYNFLGWFKKNGTWVGMGGTEFTPTKNSTLRGKWRAKRVSASEFEGYFGLAFAEGAGEYREDFRGFVSDSESFFSCDYAIDTHDFEIQTSGCEDFLDRATAVFDATTEGYLLFGYARAAFTQSNGPLSPGDITSVELIRQPNTSVGVGTFFVHQTWDDTLVVNFFMPITEATESNVFSPNYSEYRLRVTYKGQTYDFVPIMN